MYAVMAYDTEDVYFPPEYRVDDIPGWLAQTMTDTGIRGTFFVMGEKARSLKARGREDVLRKMAQHDIASHQQGNCRPLLPQVVEHCGWDDGIEALRAYEDGVRESLVGAFGKEPTGFSRHNEYFAPQHVALAGERGLPYMYIPTPVKEYPQPLWYAGTLCFEFGPAAVNGFDTMYSNDALFAQRMEEADMRIRDAAEKGCEFILVFGCHPCRVMTRGWQEHHVLTSGSTRTPEELGWLYAVKTPAEEKRAQANFRKLCEYLRDHPDIEIIGLEEAGKRFASQPDEISRDTLSVYAEAAGEAAKPLLHAVFSPAELACAFAEAILQHATAGDVPPFVKRRNVLGPVSRPVIAEEKDAVTQAELVELCSGLAAHVEEHGRLPANLGIGDSRIGIGQFAWLAARAYQALARYDRYERLHNRAIPRYPDTAFEIDAWVRRSLGEHWALPLDFDCSRIAELARLQTWTMKPAWLTPPQGPYVDGARMLDPAF